MSVSLASCSWPDLGSSASSVTASLVDASDADLARALIANDPEAHRVSWNRFSPLVIGMVRRACRHRVDCQDIVQEVFFCLFRRVHTLRDPVALRGFVIAVTLRTLSFEVRKRRTRFRLTVMGTGEFVDDVLGPSADPVAQHALVVLRRLLRRLRKRDSTAFVLRFVEGMTAEEVAAALGVSAPTARRSFSRASKRIKAWASHDPFLVDYTFPTSRRDP